MARNGRVSGAGFRPLAIVALALLSAVALVGSSLLSPPSAGAYAGAPWFRPGSIYTQNFPDPSVMRVGSTYYAYATPTGGSYLPVMSSTDLVHWTARPAYNPGPPLNGDPYFNDALPYPASWAAEHPGTERMRKEIWAPGVAAIGGQYVAFYTARVSLQSHRFCISVATASSPLGPFTDNTSGPLVCDSDPNGSIDPQPFVDVDGTPWLIWKSEGVPGLAPTHIWARQLAPSGTSFAPGSTQVSILHTSQAWEGNLIESPSMVRYRGQLYLFYSANDFQTPAYAIGMATCSSVLGPCTKLDTNPIIASSGDRLGPGGPSAFVDAAGKLRLAYHWWNAPHTTYPAYPACVAAGSCTTQGQRRLAVDTIEPATLGWAVGLGVAAADAGYWIASEGGGVAARGGAAEPTAPPPPIGRVVGMASTPSGRGWWIASANGGVAAGGEAADLGNVAWLPLTLPIVGVASTPSGAGYWLVAADGGIFSFGDARFYGSTGAMRLNSPVVGMAATPGSAGYWLVAADGGIFSFGDAPFHGSAGALPLVQPVTGMAATRSGDGYWMLARDGGIFTYGSARFFGAG
ncbi:MAG: glycoside hydrolase family 43 protein [Acidimicrobiia bacterium]